MKRGSAKPRRRPAGSEPVLARELRSRLSGPSKSTKQSLAKSAGVSTLTVQEVERGTYATDPRPSNDPEECSPRQLRGYVEALTRLAVFLGLEPKEQVEAYGIDLNWAGVNGWVTRTARRNVIAKGMTDEAIDTIVDRGGVEFGILRWQPFTKYGEPLANSWAYRYVARLIGSLNPRWNRQAPREFNSINDAIESLTSRVNQPEIVFGIYDTPYRRLRGLRFLHLPGLGIPLGALGHQDSDATTQALSWSSIIRSGRDHGRPIRAVVVDDEVGHLFLMGACGYVDDDLVVWKGEMTPELAEVFLHEVSEPRGKRVILVADRLTCERVRSWLRDPSWIDGAALSESARAVAREIGFVPDDRTVPVYRVGLALPSEADRLADLLAVAQSEELFRNARSLTASEYAQLLAQSAEVRPLPLRPDLPQFEADAFAEECVYALGKLLEDPVYDSSAVQSQIRACRQAWSLNPE